MQIVYRARIVGTDAYSAPGLVSLMQSWVGSGRASIMVQSSRLHLDPTCDAYLDTLKAPDCEGGGEPSTTIESTEPVASASPAGANSPGASVGEIGGIAVGVLVAALLIILIVLVVVVIMWKMKSQLSVRYTLR